MLDFSSLNFTAILVAAIAAFVIGFLWHGPLFGAQWMKMRGISKSEVEAAKKRGMGPMVPSMIWALIQQIVTAGVMAEMTKALSVTSATTAVLFAILVWLGFIVTSQLNAVLWEKRKMNLYLFTISYHLVSLIAIALIVVMWK